MTYQQKTRLLGAIIPVYLILSALVTQGGVCV